MWSIMVTFFRGHDLNAGGPALSQNSRRPRRLPKVHLRKVVGAGLHSRLGQRPTFAYTSQVFGGS